RRRGTGIGGPWRRRPRRATSRGTDPRRARRGTCPRGRSFRRAVPGNSRSLHQSVTVGERAAAHVVGDTERGEGVVEIASGFGAQPARTGGQPVGDRE